MISVGKFCSTGYCFTGEAGKKWLEKFKGFDKEYYPKDVAATIFTKLGVALDKTHTTPDGRPVRICDGEPIPELMG